MSLSRHFPGGRPAFIDAMNYTAQAMGMTSTRFADPAGLSNGSMSSARDLLRLVSAAYHQPLIRHDSTQPEREFVIRGRTLTFANSNRLIRGSGDWDIGLQKTGFTDEAGRCLVMQATINRRRLAMVFLDSNGAMTRFADATRVRRQIERHPDGPASEPAEAIATAAASPS
jgi:D-alanyl-D-alanine endopeptidase (penicillin-binding protein 7)